MKISIICVYNNSAQVNDCFLRGLKKQDVDYELILLDGGNGKFKSCAAALNEGAKKSSGDILVFSHQDIYMKSEKELKSFAEFICNSPKGSIVGCAGAIEGNRKNIGNYTSGLSINEDLENKIHKPIEVDSVDECFFGMTKKTYEMHPFDEILCSDWHLYAVEQCLYHRTKENHIFVFPCQIHHLSKGKINLSYMNGLVKIADKYRKNFKYIWTTCYKVRNNYLYVRVLRILWILNRKMRRREL